MTGWGWSYAIASLKRRSILTEKLW